MYEEVAENGAVHQSIIIMPSDEEEMQGTCEILNGISYRIVRNSYRCFGEELCMYVQDQDPRT